MKSIASIVKVSDQGISRPFLCKDESDGIRWCKGSHTGFRSLIAEWLCACLAREVGLPIPDFGIFRLELDRFRSWKTPQNVSVPDLVTETNQHVFGSLNVENCKDVFDPKVELRHIDRRVLAKIYWMDEAIRNTDRTDFNSNLLVNGSVYIIDHNNAFDPAFDKTAFANEHILRGFRDELSSEEVAAFQKRIRNLIQGDFLENAWDEMPSAWAEAGEDVLSLDSIRNMTSEGKNV